VRSEQVVPEWQVRPPGGAGGGQRGMGRLERVERVLTELRRRCVHPEEGVRQSGARERRSLLHRRAEAVQDLPEAAVSGRGAQLPGAAVCPVRQRQLPRSHLQVAALLRQE